MDRNNESALDNSMCAQLDVTNTVLRAEGFARFATQSASRRANGRRAALAAKISTAELLAAKAELAEMLKKLQIRRAERGEGLIGKEAPYGDRPAASNLKATTK